MNKKDELEEVNQVKLNSHLFKNSADLMQYAHSLAMDSEKGDTENEI